MASDIKLSTQDDLDVVWLQVVSEFEKETGSRLQPANGEILSVSDVIDGIDPHRHVTSGTKNKAIRVTQSILSCVQVFGGFVASAASGVFGPSQQCFSALNHVITTTQKYSEVFEDLTTLLERVSVFLETLSNYLDEGDAEVKLDKRLRPNVYRVLEHFLVILTLTTRLAKRREKARLFGKLLIAGDDGGVTAALATLETRVVDVTRVQITTIGKDLSVAARGLRDMQGDIDAILKYDEENSVALKSLAATESSRASAEAIRSWLNLEDTQSWRHQHARLTEKCVRGTGSWLFGKDSFSQWKDPNSTETKVILITGKANRGKSCLASAVIDHLRDSMEKTGGPVHPLAYHYLQDTTQRPSSISLALKSIVWQLGQLDRSYYTFVSKACADGVGLPDAVAVWRKLLSGYTPSKQTTFFVLLDGLDKSMAETIQIIAGEATRQCEASTHEAWNHEAATPSHLQIRLFLSGSSEAISLLDDATSIHKITLDPGFDKEKMVANTDDVQEVIRKRLGSMPIFRQEVTPFKKQQQQETMHTLTMHIQNDFAALDLVFEELERCTNLHQLKTALERVDEDMSVRFGRHIDSLNLSLSQHEILEVNAIMACITTMGYSMNDAWGPNIELVQEYVDFSLRTTRLIPLKQQIEQTYHSILLITAEGQVLWRHEELKGYLEERSGDERTMRTILAKRAKRSDLLDLEELNLLEKVVQTNLTHVFGAYGNELFDKYGFTEFFASKREPYKVCISFGQRESRFATLLICLQIICEDIDVHRCHELRIHALDTVYDRLESVLRWRMREEYGWAASKQEKFVAWSAIKEEKVAVGRCLAKILRNDAVIDAYARDGPRSIGTGCSTGSWPFGEWLVELEPDDLEDREEKEWFRAWKSDAGSCWDYVSNRLIRRWLKMGNEEWLVARCFVDGWNMAQKHASLCIKFADDGPETLQRITKLMIEVCGDTTRLNSEEKIWLVNECENILQVSNKTWWALFSVAKHLDDSRGFECYSFASDSIGMTQIQKAHDYIKAAISLELFEDENYANRYWREMLPLFARYQAYLRNLDGAKKTYIHMMRSPKSQNLLNLGLFMFFEPGMIMELVQVALSVLVEPSGHSLFHQMTSGDLTAEDSFSLRLAAHADCNWQSIVDFIEDSILAGSSSQMLWSAMAHLFWYKSGDTQREDRALDVWKQGGETQAIVDALLGRAKSEAPHNPLESYSFQRLQRLHPEISDPTDNPNISCRSKLMIAGWQYQSGQVIEAREFISALLRHREYDICRGDDRDRDDVLEDWGFACIALGNEDLGVLLLEQIQLTTQADPFVSHDGCLEICHWPTDDTAQPNNKPILLYCKTCLAIITPKCRATVEKGLGVPNLCEPGHQYLPMRRLQVPPEEEDRSREKVDINYGAILYVEYEEPNWVTKPAIWYTIWSDENDGTKRAQELYGWADPVFV
ncbi:neutral amino acid permease [Colletotrichum camelliae]|nr:neutral amino acid permease [Colletotrichum camelliae]